MRGFPIVIAAVLAVTTSSPAWAQAVEPELDLDDEATEVEELVVTAARPRGQVVGDIAPEITLSPAEIRAFGATNLTELLDALAPQLSSGRGRGEGRPVVLLNGRRISGFREVRDLPPEAIERVEILPEEVALKYGYRADQRVVNIVLRRRFRARTLELEAGAPTAGGRVETEIDGGQLRIAGDARWSVNVEQSRTTSITEAERDVVRSQSRRPFSVTGNIAAADGGEIDPALSALAGSTTTVVAVPASAAGGAATLADFAAGAGSPSLTDLRSFRTLTPETGGLAINTVLSRPIGDVSATVNAALELTESESLLGLPSATLRVPAGAQGSPFANDVLLYRYADSLGALRRESETATGSLGGALNGEFGADWRWSLTGGASLTRSRTETDNDLDVTGLQAAINAGQANAFGPLAVSRLAPDRAESTDVTANAELVLNGSPFELPAGRVSTTFKAQADHRGFDSETRRDGAQFSTDLSRDRGAVAASVDLPVASERNDVLTWLGDLTLNGNVEVEQLSDFGTLRVLGAGLNWSPAATLDLIASVTDEDGAPGVPQLGDPVLSTPNVPVFDFATGRTVEVTRLSGGNPALVADNRRVLKLGGTWKPLDETDLSLSLNYVRERIDDPIASFPQITPEIEAAFPERVVRDQAGTLLSIDSRPVNFARSDREELRWGVNWSKRLGPPPRAASDAPDGPRRGGQGAGAGRRGDGPPGAGRGGGFGGRPGQGRLQLALYHTWRLKESILIRDGLPELDLLDGSAGGSSGGVSEHALELQAGVFRNGLGARLDGRYQSGTTVDGEVGSGSAGDLTFSPLTTLNLRLFADLGQRRDWVANRPWLRGTRVSLRLDNLFDDRIEVTDATGIVPTGYQSDLLDPVGRAFRIEFRKLFLPARPRRDRDRTSPAVAAPGGGD